MRLGVGRLVALIAAIAMLAFVGGCGSLVQGGGQEQQGGSGQQQEQQQGQQGGEDTQQQEQQASGGETTQEQQGGEQGAQAPEDPTLSLSIPSLNKNIENIPTGRGDDEQLLTDNAAIHVFPTGFPWQEGANTYLAGHVEGYPGTPSYKAFEGLRELQNGDEIIITDANGTEYTYEVFEGRVIDPTDTSVLDPVPGRSIVTLQTCEIVEVNPDGTPNYSDTERYIVQGELVS
ncbi:sortase [Rubrobacter radiotolerans]|uniref:Class E sortase n=1 Tax=Rubrobacter radiotolerans TaxID=42256 RepID=A0AB35TCU7_RUBRA|nr:class E sortase [Rubrobacter radiotolerans]MDX5895005.1 class E sortase [Rubrobacter radiotolerans]